MTEKDSCRIDRNPSLDLLRIIAALAVIMIHVSAEFVVRHENNTVEFILGNIFDSISRLGVPVFLMISGALMLDENRKINIKRNITRLTVLFIIWSLFYATVYQIIFPIIKNENISTKRMAINFIQNLITGHYHMWYIFAIVGLYLITPVLRCIVKKENAQTVRYFILLSMFFQFSSPLIQSILEKIGVTAFINLYNYLFGNMCLDFLGGLTAYYLSGWYFTNIKTDKKTKAFVYISGIVSIVLTVLLTQLGFEYTYSNNNILIFAYSVSVFLLISNIHISGKRKNAMERFSKLTFGVYLIHILVLTVISTLLPYERFPFLYILILWFLVSIFSFLISFFISKIPFVKKAIKT